MRFVTVAATIGAYLGAAAVALAIILSSKVGKGWFALPVGALLGTQIGVVVHHRQKGSTNSMNAKLVLGMSQAITAVVFVLITQEIFSAYEFVEVTLAIGTIGSFLFPLLLFDTFWSKLSKKM